MMRNRKRRLRRRYEGAGRLAFDGRCEVAEAAVLRDLTNDKGEILEAGTVLRPPEYRVVASPGGRQFTIHRDFRGGPREAHWYKVEREALQVK